MPIHLKGSTIVDGEFWVVVDIEDVDGNTTRRANQFEALLRAYGSTERDHQTGVVDGGTVAPSIGGESPEGFRVLETGDDPDTVNVTVYINRSTVVEGTVFGEDEDKDYAWTLDIFRESLRPQTGRETQLREQVNANGANRTIDPEGYADEDD